MIKIQKIQLTIFQIDITYDCYEETQATYELISQI